MREEVRPGRREGVVGGDDASGMHGEGATECWGTRARAERTRNMPSMVVTLDVSKFSGWLNANALCRVEKGSLRGRDAGGRREGLRCAAQGRVQGGPNWRVGAGREQCTP